MSKVSSNNPTNNRTHTPSSSTSQPFNYAAAAAKAKAANTPNATAPKAPATATSSPSLGPTNTAPNSGAVTPIPNGSKPASGAQTPAGGMSAGKGAPRPPSSTRGSHLKQGSISASRPINLKDPTPVNFGTIDDSNATLSSSPAAPPTLGARKPPVFGSITDTPPSTGDAAPAPVAAPLTSAAPVSSAAAPAATAAPAGAAAEFDFDAMFSAKPDVQPEPAVSSPATGLAPESRRSGSLAGSPAPAGLTPPAQPGQHGHHVSHLSTASRPFSPNHAGPPPSVMSPYGQPGFQHFPGQHISHPHPGHHPHPHGGGHPQTPGTQQPPAQYPSQPGNGPYPNGAPTFTPASHSKNASNGPMMHQGPGTPGPGGFQPNGPGGPPQSGQQARGGQNAFGPMHGGQRPSLPTQHPSHGSQSSQQQGGKSNYPASPKVSTAPTPQPQQAMHYPPYYGQPQFYGNFYVHPGQQPYAGMSPGSAPSGPSPGPASAVASPASQTRALPPLAGTPSSQSTGTPSWQPPHYSASPATAQSTMPSTPTGSEFRPSSAASHAPSSAFNAGATEFRPSAATGFKPVPRTSAAIQIRKPPADMAKKSTAPAPSTPAPASKESTPAAAATPAQTPTASEAPKAATTPSSVSRAIDIRPPPAEKKAAAPSTEKKQEQAPEDAKSKSSVTPAATPAMAPAAAEKKIDEPATSAPTPQQKTSEPEPKSKNDSPAKVSEAVKADDAPEKAKAVDAPVAAPSVDAAAKTQAEEPTKPAQPTQPAAPAAAVPSQEPTKADLPPSSTKDEASRETKPTQETSKAPLAAEPTVSGTSSLSSSTATESGESKPLSGVDTKATSVEPTRESTPVSAAPSLATVDESAPVKPATNGVNGTDSEKKKRTVPPLDLSHSRKVSQDGSPQTASVQALASAKPILDLTKVTYPADVQSPSAELNVDAKPGEYRYDRTFMLQFMNICKEKPDGLPSLEAIGMIEDGSATPGGGLSRPASMSGANRRASAGIPNASRQPSGVFPMMGSRASSFAAAPMGQFVKGGSGASMTSEERFQQSQQNRVAGSGLPGAPFGGLPGRPGGSMSRTPSVGPGMALGPGGNRRSQQGRKRAPQPMLSTGEVVQPLEVSENRWQPTSASNAATADPLSAEVVQRKVKSLLNKLTLENFDSISAQILDWANKSEQETDGRILRQVIALIFEKATDEAFWSSLYARLCRYLMEKLSSEVRDHSLSDQSGGHVGGGHLFRKYLLTRCQEDYERGWHARDEAVAAAAAKDKEIAEKKAAEEADKKNAGGGEGATEAEADAEKTKEGDKPKEAELLSDEYYIAQKAKRRGLGLVSFIGELYKLNMLKDGIMHECVVKLLSNVEDPEEEMVESLCRLMRTVGKALDHAQKGEGRMDIYFNRMSELLKAPLDSRLKFMVQDVIDLRKDKWQARNEQTGPKTIAEIHQQAEAEKLQKEMDDRRNASAGKGLPNLQNQLGRTGSRRGQGRQDSFQQSADGWNTVGTAAPRAPAKIGDITQIGRIRDSGRSSMFKKREDKTSGKTSNPFDMLVNADAGPSAAPPETPSERPRLSLLPRTKPMPDSAADSPQPEGDDAEAEVTSGEMPADVKQSIKNSVEEFFAVRNIDEGVAVFSTLAKPWHNSLVTALTEKVLEKKVDDVKLAASLYKQLQTEKIFSSGNFKDAFAPLVKTAPDISADVPNLYKFFGTLLVAAGLQEEDVTALSKTMESEEEDVEDAQQQLLEAYKKASA